MSLETLLSPLKKNKTICTTILFFLFTCIVFVFFWFGVIESTATTLHFFKNIFSETQITTGFNQINLNSVFVNLVYPTETNQNIYLINNIFDTIREHPINYKIYIGSKGESYILLDNKFYEIKLTSNFWIWTGVLFIQNPIFYFIMTRLLNTQELNIRTEHMISEKIDQDYLADKVAQTMGGYIHHELKTPLTAIEAISTKNRLIIDKLNINDDIKQEFLNNCNLLENSIMNMFNTINAVQQLKAIDDNENISIYDIIERSLNIFKLSSNYKFIYLVDKELKRCRPDKLNPHLLSNIIINHAKNSLEADAKIIKFEYSNFYIKNNIKLLHMYIIDDGKGIPKNILKTVYELKFTTKESGTGVGLYICKGVLNQFGGDENIQQSSKYGTVIDLEIPVLECKRTDTEVDSLKGEK